MVEISLVYEGGLHCTARHGPSGSRLDTDAPVDNRGRGETFSPTDLVATALASCMATLVGMLADDRGWNLSGMRLRVEKHMSTDAPRRIVRLPVRLEMPVDLPLADRERVRRAAEGCPVRQSLHPDIDQTLTLSWPH